MRAYPIHGPATSGDLQEGYPQRAVLGVSSGVRGVERG